MYKYFKNIIKIINITLIISIISVVIYVIDDYYKYYPLLEKFGNSPAESFCKSYSGKDLNEKCGGFTERNCNKTSCCIWTSESKCVAGNVDGPLYNTNKSGKTIVPDYFYFQNKCFGEKCK